MTCTEKEYESLRIGDRVKFFSMFHFSQEFVGIEGIILAKEVIGVVTKYRIQWNKRCPWDSAVFHNWSSHLILISRADDNIKCRKNDK
jgi:hypothetical protein